ncbi:MAG: hypothetical protein AAGC70_18060 [Pseudomonadota bacterium]
MDGLSEGRRMPILTELIVSIVGGVATAIILAAFSGRRRAETPTAHQAQSPAPRSRSVFGDLLRLLVAVAGGIAIAMVGGRILIQSGVLPGGLPTRLGLMVGGTTLVWLLLVGLRRK